METLHTTGEWYAKDGQIVAQATGRTLALIPYYFYNEDEEQTANANLMAAAPKLLEALREAVESMDQGMRSNQLELYKKAQAAIQKAINP
jgi:hypothetical protein